MRMSPLPVVLALAAAGAAAWLLLRSGPPEPLGGKGALERPDATPESGGRLSPVELSGRAPTGTGGTTSQPRGSDSIDPRTLPRGTLEVAVLGPDDQPIPSEEVRVLVEPGKGARDWYSTPLLLTEPGSNVWKHEGILAGPVRVTVSGDMVVTKVVETRVEVGTPVALKVHVDRAGVIAYAATLYSGEAPEQVTLTLLDAQRRPVSAHFQVRTESVLTQPRMASTITQGPAGVVFGLPAGRYILRAVSPSEEYDEASVDVAVGSATEVKFSIRK